MSRPLSDPAGGAAVATRSGGVSPAAWIGLLRPRQWVKNAFVMAPLVFSGRAREPEVIVRSIIATALFCLLASGVYALNDVRDREADRLHPTKRHRPVASGRIGVSAAIAAGIVLIVAAIAGSAALDPRLGLVAGTYFALNVAYTLKLKEVVILDVFLISAFFMLRLLAGAVAISVRPSIWLLLCGGLLSLYLGFAKRRHELLLLADDSTEHRSVLAHYGPEFLDQMSVVLLSVTIVSYIMYTLTSETAILVGSESLAYSTVFVLYGVFRYLYLVHQKGRGSPTETLLTDPSLMVTILLWLGYCGWVIYRPF